ncbi:hypothetical protein GS429_08420 [Natronorubrum sp. JWXQ-INN-674]|uniref:Uncharacterized protein n=1 Tax=Natronorubrum halalkaliphilum TaxID=2691917 RepID=A0A6B0VKK2_9EURY|nr:hypothetical protein [Natronorubrum halalkaliphilum]MXV62084.1 hypothetical protein [Natronorubrum halalkaliphilum]
MTLQPGANRQDVRYESGHIGKTFWFPRQIPDQIEVETTGTASASTSHTALQTSPGDPGDYAALRHYRPTFSMDANICVIDFVGSQSGVSFQEDDQEVFHDMYVGALDISDPTDSHSYGINLTTGEVIEAGEVSHTLDASHIDSGNRRRAWNARIEMNFDEGRFRASYKHDGVFDSYATGTGNTDLWNARDNLFGLMTVEDGHHPDFRLAGARQSIIPTRE